MKILFLQKVDNARGGVINVNLGLMRYFLKQGYECEMIAIRHGYTWETIDYPTEVKKQVINTKNIWGMPLKADILACLKKGQLISAIKLFWQRIVYQREIGQDYLNCQQAIKKMAPDVIINSHYEVLAGVPKEYLAKTIMHFHTSYDQVKANKSYQQVFQKFHDKIAYFVWLSKSTCERAIADGYQNSVYIYNALNFNETQVADMKTKKLVFVGRIAPEKRVDLAVDHFLKAITKPELKDWTFEIYGDGDEVEALKAKIASHPQVIYQGRSNYVQEVFLRSSLMIMTSSFEGMPLVVLEANECGVPVIAYDFGESSQEVIISNKTGLVIKQDDKETFQACLEDLMANEEKRSSLARQAKAYAKHFTMDEIGKQWENLFSLIVGSRLA